MARHRMCSSFKLIFFSPGFNPLKTGMDTFAYSEEQRKAAESGISSGSALFAKIFRKRNTIQ